MWYVCYRLLVKWSSFSLFKPDLAVQSTSEKARYLALTGCQKWGRLWGCPPARQIPQCRDCVKHSGTLGLLTHLKILQDLTHVVPQSQVKQHRQLAAFICLLHLSFTKKSAPNRASTAATQVARCCVQVSWGCPWGWRPLTASCGEGLFPQSQVLSQSAPASKISDRSMEIPRLVMDRVRARPLFLKEIDDVIP